MGIGVRTRSRFISSKQKSGKQEGGVTSRPGAYAARSCTLRKDNGRQQAWWRIATGQLGVVPPSQSLPYWPPCQAARTAP